MRLTGSVQDGEGEALSRRFDWFDEEVRRRSIWFDRSEYGGERDILLLPCRLVNLDNEPAWLWTPTTAAKDRHDPWVVEIVASRSLRRTFHLANGSIVEVELLNDAPHAASGGAE